MTPAKPAAARKAKAASKAPKRVLAATERDLARLPKDLADSAVAASALALAETLDDPYNSATSKSMCAKSLREALERLAELAPEEETEDDLDRLKGDRERRREGVAEA